LDAESHSGQVALAGRCEAALRWMSKLRTEAMIVAVAEKAVPQLVAATTSPVASLSKGVAKDRAAIAAAINTPWSDGQTEGRICRLKTLDRQMGGRANVDLLRA
jgi:transposase